MKRSENCITQRKELVKISIDNPSAGAALVGTFASRLNKAHGTNEIVKILSELLGVSETTVFRDFSS